MDNDEREDLVTVYTVNSAPEAEIVRGSLESVGIPCQIGGETQAGLAGVLEIDILTHESDAERAIQHLQMLRKEMDERRQGRLDGDDADDDDDVPSDAIQE